MASACPRCGGTVAPSARRCPHCDAALAGRAGDRVQLSTPRPTDLGSFTPPPPPPSTAQKAAEGLVEGTRTGVRVGTRLWRRLSRRGKIILAVTVAALVVGVPATLWVVGKVAYAPDEPVDDLVSAFNDRDLARVATLAGCSSGLCSPQALATGYEPPSGMSIVTVAMGGSTSPDTADIRVRYTLAGQRQESVVRVRRESSLFPSEWRIVSGLTGRIEVTAPGLTSVTVGGVEVAVDAASGRGQSSGALIGAYTVTPGRGSTLYEAKGTTAVVANDLRNGRVTAVDLTPTVRTPVLDNARKQIRDFLQACARSADYEPTVDGRECPFAHKWPLPDKSTPAAWTLDPFPEFELVPPDKPTTKSQLEVRTTKPGRATVTYTSQNQPRTYRYEVTVGGTVTVGDNDSITWTQD